MTFFRPAIIKYRSPHQRYEAYNQNGRLILHRTTYALARLALTEYDYNLVPFGHPSYHDIIDKLQAKGVVQILN